MNDINLQIKARNNILLQELRKWGEERGVPEKKQVRIFCETNKIGECNFRSLLNFKSKAIKGKATAYKKVAKAFNMKSEDLFPEFLYEAVGVDKIEIEISANQYLQLDSQEVLQLESKLSLGSKVNNQFDRDLLIELMDEHLNVREKKCIMMRFGFMDGCPRTLDEVGKEFGVTRERIRQFESQALHKLREVAGERFLLSNQ